MEDPAARIAKAISPDELRAIATELAEDAARLEVELATAKRSRELLLNSVAHDLRNPLNTFAMSVGLLRDDLERHDLDPARALSLVRRIERSTQRMQSIVEDLVEASRVEARAVELRPKDELVAAVVKKAAAAAQPLAEERHVRIVCSDVDESARVHVDPERTVQAIVKLVAYALRSTGEGGSVALGALRDEGRVEIGVRAIPPPGAPISTSHDTARGGLSLLIGRGLFEAHGATVVVEPDGVTVTLPSAD